MTVTKPDLSSVYRDYTACLNRQDWPKPEGFVAAHVQYNDREIGLPAYRKMPERDFYAIPDLHFNVQLLISGAPCIAARLSFACSPKGEFLGLAVNGKKVFFTENVFYKFREEKITAVWPLIDKAAVEAQACPGAHDGNR
ncbi:MAG: ester cyclase [Treponema sp.]|jgi:predicted ester cyclase|nr:ester cyclase [Treponema sp.]